jgi:uncharacterized protein YndB with AHSA1/START domain
VSRTRTIAAPAEDVWALVSDPYNLPRWWPRCSRVESVGEDEDGPGRWTTVLETEAGSVVRADYRLIDSQPPSRYGWEQELEGTPFERILRSSGLAVRVEPSRSGTRVALTADQRLRGLSRLGSPMMRRGTGKTLEEALDGIERAMGRAE